MIKKAEGFSSLSLSRYTIASSIYQVVHLVRQKPWKSEWLKLKKEHSGESSITDVWRVQNKQPRFIVYWSVENSGIKNKQKSVLDGTQPIPWKNSSPKNEKVIIYLPSWCSKPIWFSFWTINKLQAHYNFKL